MEMLSWDPPDGSWTAPPLPVLGVRCLLSHLGQNTGGMLLSPFFIVYVKILSRSLSVSKNKCPCRIAGDSRSRTTAKSTYRNLGGKWHVHFSLQRCFRRGVRRSVVLPQVATNQLWHFDLSLTLLSLSFLASKVAMYHLQYLSHAFTPHALGDIGPWHLTFCLSVHLCPVSPGKILTILQPDSELLPLETLLVPTWLLSLPGV